jgi:hypothetical protein
MREAAMALLETKEIVGPEAQRTIFHGAGLAIVLGVLLFDPAAQANEALGDPLAVSLVNDKLLIKTSPI